MTPIDQKTNPNFLESSSSSADEEDAKISDPLDFLIFKFASEISVSKGASSGAFDTSLPISQIVDNVAQHTSHRRTGSRTYEDLSDLKHLKKQNPDQKKIYRRSHSDPETEMLEEKKTKKFTNFIQKISSSPKAKNKKRRSFNLFSRNTSNTNLSTPAKMRSSLESLLGKFKLSKEFESAIVLRLSTFAKEQYGNGILEPKQIVAEFIIKECNDVVAGIKAEFSGKPGKVDEYKASMEEYVKNFSQKQTQSLRDRLAEKRRSTTENSVNMALGCLLNANPQFFIDELNGYGDKVKEGIVEKIGKEECQKLQIFKDEAFIDYLDIKAMQFVINEALSTQHELSSSFDQSNPISALQKGRILRTFFDNNSSNFKLNGEKLSDIDLEIDSVDVNSQKAFIKLLFLKLNETFPSYNPKHVDALVDVFFEEGLLDQQQEMILEEFFDTKWLEAQKKSIDNIDSDNLTVMEEVKLRNRMDSENCLDMLTNLNIEDESQPLVNQFKTWAHKNPYLLVSKEGKPNTQKIIAAFHQDLLAQKLSSEIKFLPVLQAISQSALGHVDAAIIKRGVHLAQPPNAEYYLKPNQGFGSPVAYNIEVDSITGQFEVVTKRKHCLYGASDVTGVNGSLKMKNITVNRNIEGDLINGKLFSAKYWFSDIEINHDECPLEELDQILEYFHIQEPRVEKSNFLD